MTQTQRLDVRELINRNPLSRFQKQIIFLGFCVIALDGFDIAIMGFIAPTLKLEWGVSNHQLGLVISAALIGLALGAIFSGPLADWLGRKKIIINSVFFFGFWTIATAFSHNIEQMNSAMARRSGRKASRSSSARPAQRATCRGKAVWICTV